MANQDSTACATLEDLQQKRREFTDALLAANTRLGYGYDWAAFEAWSAALGLPALPASVDTVAWFIASQLTVRKLKVSTVSHQVAAIRRKHIDADLESPVTQKIADLLRGARRVMGEQPRQALPISVAELRAICVLLLAERSAASIRNRAILLTQFLAAMRNCETAGLFLSDVRFTDLGALLNIRRGKCDQESKGRLVSLLHGRHRETDPVGALKEYITERGDAPGPLFRRFGELPADQPLLPERIGQIIQNSARQIGIKTSGHGCRAGFTTAAGEAGASDLLISWVTGMTNMATVRRYFRPRDAFANNPSKLLDI